MADVTTKHGIPLLSSVYDRVGTELAEREQAGFLYFDVVEFGALQEEYGRAIGQALLDAMASTLMGQRGKLFRDEDLVAVGGSAFDYFVIFLFSPPRRKASFSVTDLKLISGRATRKLFNILNNRGAELGVTKRIDLRSGYTVLQHDPNVTAERLIYEAHKEAALKSQMDEIMVTFVANVSHELRTPLTCIKGYAETLLEGALDDRELTTRWLSVICTEAKRLERLIKDLLDISMIEADQVEMRFQMLDLGALVQHAYDILAPHAKDANIEIVLEMPEDRPEWRVDEDRLSQVVLNLIDNGIKYSNGPGHVYVRLFYTDEKVTIEVEDEGTGIPDEELPRIFERFYRVEKGSTARFGGRGLGLSIAKHLIEAHGGDLTVESEMGKGSKFFIHLPVTDDWELDDED